MSQIVTPDARLMDEPRIEQRLALHAWQEPCFERRREPAARRIPNVYIAAAALADFVIGIAVQHIEKIGMLIKPDLVLFVPRAVRRFMLEPERIGLQRDWRKQ